MLILTKICLTLCLFLAACGDKERESQRASYNNWTRQLQTQETFTPEQLSGVWVLDRLVTLYSDTYDHRHDSALHKDYSDNSVLLIFSEGKYVRSTIQNNCAASAVSGDWLVELGTHKEQVEDTKQPKDPNAPIQWKWVVNAGLTAQALFAAATTTKREKFAPFELERDLLKTTLAFRESRKREPHEETRLYRLQEIDGKKTLELTHTNTLLTSGIHTLVERYHALSDDELKNRFQERIKTSFPCAK
jgi:hypothetical protein